MCLEGGCIIGQKGQFNVEMKMGETVLIPASLHHIVLDPVGQHTRIAEVYIK
jgi:hypothetical protein